LAVLFSLSRRSSGKEEIKQNRNKKYILSRAKGKRTKKGGKDKREGEIIFDFYVFLPSHWQTRQGCRKFAIILSLSRYLKLFPC
jgi:hypothetical protein